MSKKSGRKESAVYFAESRARVWNYDYSVPAKLEELIARIDLSQYITPGEYVAIKMHLGSRGAFRIVRPNFVRMIADAIKDAGGKPFVTDSVRMMGWEYLDNANRLGINRSSLGVPVVLADGLYGRDGIVVKAGPILGKTTVASAIYDAPAMVVVTHAKGHLEAGYAGAMKNLAMGAICTRDRGGSTRYTRGRMHAIDQKSLVWKGELCVLCGNCEAVCPLGAIKVVGNKVVRDTERCWLCLRCARVCPTGALVSTMKQEEFQLGLAEAVRAVLSTFEKGKVVYFNFVMDVQPECDCMPVADNAIVADQGILVSDDIVAIDQASYDLIRYAAPLPQSEAEDRKLKKGDDILAGINTIGQPQILINKCAQYRLGSKRFRIVKVTRKRRTRRRR
jgi:uncharacterized Fe-S center protein